MNVDESTRMVPKRDVTRRMRTGKIQGRTFWSNVSEIIRCCYIVSYDRYPLCTKYNMLAESLKTNLHSTMNTTQTKYCRHNNIPLQLAY